MITRISQNRRRDTGFPSEGVDIGDLGTVTVRGDGTAEYVGPLTPVDIQPKKKK
jgi:hypothetical protein